MGSEKPKAKDVADAGDAVDVDARLKAAWDRRTAKPTPSALIDHVEQLIADGADDQTP